MCQTDTERQDRVAIRELTVDMHGRVIDNPPSAEVAELADAQDSKSCPRKGVRVRFPPSAMRTCTRGVRHLGDASLISQMADFVPRSKAQRNRSPAHRS